MPGRAMLPRLTQAQAPLTRAVDAFDQDGHRLALHLPIERALALYVDRRELVTLMTLGQAPELLALGWLRNQGLIDAPEAVESVTVDWDAGAAAVRTRAGLGPDAAALARRTVTTGCGQGTVYGDWLAGFERLRVPASAPARLDAAGLAAMIDAVRARDSVHRRAGSVHGCALFRGPQLLAAFEDVGRHNAIDTLAGWMWMHGVDGGPTCCYTTGRLTSEMVLKAARLGVPIVVSRNGATLMGLELGARLGLTLIGRAGRSRFLCYCGAERFAFGAAEAPTAAV